MNDNQNQINGWLALAEGLYEFLNRRQTTINYQFDSVRVSVPQSTEPNSPKAEWGLDGTIRLSTHENAVDKCV